MIFIKNIYAILSFTFLMAITFSEATYAQCTSCDVSDPNIAPNTAYTFAAGKTTCFTAGTTTINGDVSFGDGGSICVGSNATLILSANNYSAINSGTFAIDVQGTLKVNQNPTWSGDMEVTIAAAGKMTANTLTLNGDVMKITNNGVFEPGTLQFSNANAVITIENNGSMVVTNTLNVSSGVARFINSGDLMIKGNYNSNNVSSYINCGIFNGKFNLNNGGQVINTGTFTTEQIDFRGANSKISNYGTFNIEGTINIVGGTIYNQGSVIVKKKVLRVLHAHCCP